MGNPYPESSSNNQSQKLVVTYFSCCVSLPCSMRTWRSRAVLGQAPLGSSVVHGVAVGCWHYTLSASSLGSSYSFAVLLTIPLPFFLFFSLFSGSSLKHAFFGCSGSWWWRTAAVKSLPPGFKAKPRATTGWENFEISQTPGHPTTIPPFISSPGGFTCKFWPWRNAFLTTRLTCPTHVVYKCVSNGGRDSKKMPHRETPSELNSDHFPEKRSVILGYLGSSNRNKQESTYIGKFAHIFSIYVYHIYIYRINIDKWK